MTLRTDEVLEVLMSDDEQLRAHRVKSRLVGSTNQAVLDQLMRDERETC